MMFLMAGFRCELCFVRFLFRVFTVFPFFALFLRFFFVMAVLLALRDFVRFVEGFGLILIKIRAADERVGFSARLGFLVLGFHQPSRKRDRLFIAESGGSVAGRFGRSFFGLMNFRRC